MRVAADLLCNLSRCWYGREEDGLGDEEAISIDRLLQEGRWCLDSRRTWRVVVSRRQNQVLSGVAQGARPHPVCKARG
jgi:hypothetical protein